MYAFSRPATGLLHQRSQQPQQSAVRSLSNMKQSMLSRDRLSQVSHDKSAALPSPPPPAAVEKKLVLEPSPGFSSPGLPHRRTVAFPSPSLESAAVEQKFPLPSATSDANTGDQLLQMNADEDEFVDVVLDTETADILPQDHGGRSSIAEQTAQMASHARATAAAALSEGKRRLSIGTRKLSTLLAKPMRGHRDDTALPNEPTQQVPLTNVLAHRRAFSRSLSMPTPASLPARSRTNSQHSFEQSGQVLRQPASTLHDPKIPLPIAQLDDIWPLSRQASAPMSQSLPAGTHGPSSSAVFEDERRTVARDFNELRSVKFSLKTRLVGGTLLQAGKNSHGFGMVAGPESILPLKTTNAAGTDGTAELRQLASPTAQFSKEQRRNPDELVREVLRVLQNLCIPYERMGRYLFSCKYTSAHPQEKSVLFELEICKI